MGILSEFKEIGSTMMKRASAARSKDEIIADALFGLLYSKKLPVVNTKRRADFHSLTVEVKDMHMMVNVSRRVRKRRRTAGEKLVRLALSADEPTMCDINIRVYPKKAGFFDRILAKGVTSLHYVMNADDYIDDNLKIKKPKAFKKMLMGYLKSTGL